MTDNNLPNKILVVDDDESFIISLENALTRHNIKIIRGDKLETALYQFNTARFDVAMVELDFGELPGLAIIQKWRKHETLEKQTCGFIAVAGQSRSNLADGLIRELGEIEVVSKPLNMIGIISTIAKAMQSRRRALEYVQLKAKVTDYYMKSKDIEKTVALVTPRLHELGPSGNDLLLSLYETAESWEHALVTVSKQLENKQNDISLLNTKARILLKLGRTQDALPLFEKADAVAPLNIQRLEQLAEMYLQMQNPDKGVIKLKQLCDLHPENPEYKFDAMQKLFDAGFSDHAMDFGRKNTSPMDIVRHYNNKGVALSKSGNPEKALQEYNRALEFFPTYKENYRIHYNVALAHVTKKDAESRRLAEEAVIKCLKLNPGFEKAKNALDAIQGKKSANTPPTATPKKTG